MAELKDFSPIELDQWVKKNVPVGYTHVEFIMTLANIGCSLMRMVESGDEGLTVQQQIDICDDRDQNENNR